MTDRQNENKVGQSKRRLQAIFDSPDTFIGILSPDGTLLEANQTALDFIDATSGDVEGDYFWETPWWNHSEELQRELQKKIERAAGGEYVRFQSAHYSPAGEKITADGVLRPVANEDGEIVSLIAEARDISYRKKREEQVEALHEATRRLMAAATQREVCEVAVDTCREILDMPYAGIWLYDETDEALRSVAQTETAEEILDEVPIYKEGNSLSWQAFETGEMQVYEHIDAESGIYNPETSIESELILPLGSRGVLNIASPTASGIGQNDQYAAQLLAKNVEATLERIEREERHSEARERFQKTFEHSNVAILLTDVERNAIVDCNPATTDLLGYTRTELKSMTVSDLHPDNFEEIDAFAATVIENGHGRADEMTCYTKNGEPITVDISAAAIELNGRNHLISHLRDISDRKQYRERLEGLNEASRRLMSAETEREVAEVTTDVARSVLEQPLTAMWSYDVDADRLVPLAATDTAAKIDDGHDSEKQIGSIEPGTREMEIFHQGEPILIENYQGVENPAHPDTPLGTVLMVPLGEYGQLHVGSKRVDPFDAPTKELIEVLGQTAMVALERSEREQQLQKQNDQLEEFASVISHDLRNPLNVAMGNLDLASEEIDNEHVETAAESLDRMNDLIEGLLALSRKGQVIDDVQPINLVDLVHKAWETAVQGKQATLEIGDESLWILGDKQRVRELLENIFKNAIDHCEESVTVHVGELESGFYIEDTGPGIPPDESDAVFEFGYTTDREGTGLGLAIVRKIVSGHDWEIAVVDGPRSGARFEITGVKKPAK
jgi:PAS domain S-box-containing protein